MSGHPKEQDQAGYDPETVEKKRSSELSDCLDRWLFLTTKAARQEITEAESDEIRALERRMAPLAPKTMRELAGKTAVWYGIMPDSINGGECVALAGVPREIADIAGIPRGASEPARNPLAREIPR